MNEIVINEISKTINRKKVLKQVSLTLRGGHIYGLEGRNGSGKTMLLRAICGLIFPDEGTILIDSKQLHKDISFSPSCGVIIEHTELLPGLTAFENLKMLSKIKNTATDEQIRDTLRLVGLESDSRLKVKAYSLGMKQRLSIAQALFEDPKILLLDEPMNALDENGASVVRELLRLERDKGKLIVIASHVKEDIELLADEVIRIADGRIVE